MSQDVVSQDAGSLDAVSSNAETTPEDVLAFWFAPGRREQWFAKCSEFDAEVRQRLGPPYERAAAGDYDHWQDGAKGCLALCLLLDQVPRNLFRDDPRAFATDVKARAVLRHALEQGFDDALSQIERLFLYLPFEHSEALQDQEDCVRLTKALDEDPEWYVYAVKHRDIIARFGRFPHRNAALGRDCTEQEAAFLEEPGSSF